MSIECNLKVHFGDGSANTRLQPYLGTKPCFSLLQDEDVYTFFEPELPPDVMSLPRTKLTDTMKPVVEKRPSPKLPAGRSNSKSHSNIQLNGPNSEKKSNGSSSSSGSSRRASPENNSWNVLDLKKENYFSCAVGRPRTNARYLLNTSDDVVAFLKAMAEPAFLNFSSFHLSS